MVTKFSKIIFVLVLSAIFNLITFFPAFAEKPKEVSITTFGVGSTYFAISSAISTSVKNKAGITINVIPSGTDSGRLLPVKSGEAEFTMLAASTGWLATHAAGQFASKQWGPQKLRLAWRGGDYFVNFFTRGNAGFTSLKEIKDKRVPQIPGSSTFNKLMSGAVAFGGYTLDDVDVRNVSGATAGNKATIHGDIDLFVSSLMSSNMIELASSAKGIRWMDLDSNDKEAWKRLKSFCPWAGHGVPEIYAGKDKGHPPFTSMKYGAFFWSYDTTDDEKVYHVAKAIWDSRELYKDMHPNLKNWDHKTAADFSDCLWAFHPGYIKLLKEMGIWTTEHEKFQQKQLKREATRMALWSETLDLAKKKGIKIGSDEYIKLWMKRMSDNKQLF